MTRRMDQYLEAAAAAAAADRSPKAKRTSKREEHAANKPLPAATIGVRGIRVDAP